MKNSWYCIIPVGPTTDELLDLEEEMAIRGVELYVKISPGDTHIFRIFDHDTHKLPTDEQGFYFGDSDSGYGLGQYSDSMYVNERWGLNEFQRVSQSV